MIMSNRSEVIDPLDRNIMTMTDSSEVMGPIDRRTVALGDFHRLPDHLICFVLELLAPKDLGILSCVSSVFYIFCSEDPLWMTLCLKEHDGLIRFLGDWKQTLLGRLKGVQNNNVICTKPTLQFKGFTSLFLYRRWYRCNVNLRYCSFDSGLIERRRQLSLEEFTSAYDGKKPVLLVDLADNWPAMKKWSIDYLVENYGDSTFKVGQKNAKPLFMHLEDYASYLSSQRDEDPLYIFDAKFGEKAPGLMDDYTVPDIFKEDLFNLMDDSDRPPFKWLVIGPARSGTPWHVDPALTSAWNTLLRGEKRWALYPPGRVPPSVEVHEDKDGEVDVDCPSSLQWWMDVYPVLEAEDKPLECVQLPGETIFVPSGWWHCVLNISTSVAVTQNFVNTTNLESVCLDVAPGHFHRGLDRVEKLSLKEMCADNTKSKDFLESLDNNLSKGKVEKPLTGERREIEWEVSEDFLASYVEEHAMSTVNDNDYISPQLFFKWLQRLWLERSDLHHQIWKICNACRWD